MPMNQRKTTIAAITCGVVCAACVIAFMMTVQGQADEARAETLARYGGEQVEVCVAARDIVAGERVDAGAVRMKLWVADLLPDDPVRLSSEVVGKTASSNILRGEVISARRFATTSSNLEVPQGKVAISVPAKEVQAVGGSLLPGMRVDVYSTGDTTTALVAEGVSVLATSVAKEGSTLSGMTWVTLAVDPSKVQELIASSSKASLYFTLPGELPTTANAKPENSAAASPTTNSKDSQAADGQKSSDSSASSGSSAKKDATSEEEGR